MKHFLPVILWITICACSANNQSTSDGVVLTEQEELSVADSLATEIQSSGQTIKKEAEEAKESIDQLLEGI